MALRASLPMYDLPEIRDSTDRLWMAIADELRRDGLTDVPDVLERPRDHHDAWRPRGLLLSQSCGYPVAATLRSALRVVATPHYEVPGCEGHCYSSVVVVREPDRTAGLGALRGTVCAFNARDSQSGYNALRAMVAPIAGGAPFFARTLETGSHGASIEAVRGARADVCAVDCVTWALMARHRPSSLGGLAVLCRTESVAGLPFVTAGDASDAVVETLRCAIGRALSRPDLAEVRAALFVCGLSATTIDTYEPLLAMERAAAALRYPNLA